MTTFVDNSTVIQAVWLNGVDIAVVDGIGNGISPPTTTSAVKVNLSLDQVNNTTDLNKPISTATQTALDAKITATSTDTISNKTINLSSNILSTTVAQLNTAISDGDMLTTTGVDTLTNKTIAYAANTLTGVVGVSAIQTLSNKTLDSTCNVSDASGQPFSFRNLLVNATFQVNNGNTGTPYVSAAILAAGAYGHEMWKAGTSGGDYSFTQNPAITTITIAAGKSLIQVIEDKFVEGGSYVLSWTGTAQARIGLNSATPSGAYAASPILITGQTAGTTISAEFNTGTLSKVQLEVGSIATNFEFRQDELQRTQRYFEVLAAGGAAPSGMTFTCSNYANSTAPVCFVQFKVTKRSAPTMSASGSGSVRYITNNGVYLGASALMSNITIDGYTLSCSAAPVASFGWMDSFGNIIANARL